MNYGARERRRAERTELAEMRGLRQQNNYLWNRLFCLFFKHFKSPESPDGAAAGTFLLRARKQPLMVAGAARLRGGLDALLIAASSINGSDLRRPAEAYF